MSRDFSHLFDTTSEPRGLDRRAFIKTGAAGLVGAGAALTVEAGLDSVARAAQREANRLPAKFPTLHKKIEVDGLGIFYRDAGPADAPVILLLHGFPTSSQMFRKLIPALSDRFRVVAPDYPGFGRSDMPSVADISYTFDNLAEVVTKFLGVLGIQKYSIYLMDYGGPIGFRLAAKHPERVQSLIVQNANAYDEGLREFWDPFRAYWNDRSEQTAEPLKGFFGLDATRWQYTHGVRNAEAISPDNWIVDQYHLDRPGNRDIQLQLFYDYGSNPPLYPAWQAYFREHQPPTLIVWGQNDHIFPADGAHPYKRDLENLEFHLLDTGHFALEEDGHFIAERIRSFVTQYVG